METKAMLKKKIKSRAGESIGETLVSLLILTLSVLMLSGSVVSAAKVNHQTENMDVAFTTTNGLNVTDSTAVIKHNFGSDNVAIQVSTTKDDNKYSFYSKK